MQSDVVLVEDPAFDEIPWMCIACHGAEQVGRFPEQPCSCGGLEFLRIEKIADNPELFQIHRCGLIPK